MFAKFFEQSEMNAGRKVSGKCGQGMHSYGSLPCSGRRLIRKGTRDYLKCECFCHDPEMLMKYMREAPAP